MAFFYLGTLDKMGPGPLNQEQFMADSKQTLINEISLWRKRFFDSKKVLRGVYKDVSKDAKKVYKEALK